MIYQDIYIYTYMTSLKADKEDGGVGIWNQIQLTIISAIDSSHESTWNHMDQHWLTSINMNEHELK